MVYPYTEKGSPTASPHDLLSRDGPCRPATGAGWGARKLPLDGERQYTRRGHGRRLRALSSRVVETISAIDATGHGGDALWGRRASAAGPARALESRRCNRVEIRPVPIAPFALRLLDI